MLQREILRENKEIKDNKMCTSWEKTGDALGELEEQLKCYIWSVDKILYYTISLCRPVNRQALEM